jgi:hypothetical protein
MTFDVSKFLALTALLAGAGVSGAACSSSGGDDAQGGKSSGGNSSHAGSSNDAGGNTSDVTEGGGAGVGAAGGATGGVGGASDGGGGAAGGGGGMGGEAGAGGSAECLTHDPAYEDDPCASLPATDCDPSSEGLLNPYQDSCYQTYGAKSGVRMAYVDCVQGKDECATNAEATAASCWAKAAAAACPVEEADATCTTVVSTCATGLTAATCKKMLNASAMLDAAYVTSCMDPAGEFWDDLFVGDCTARLANCSELLGL